MIVEEVPYTVYTCFRVNRSAGRDAASGSNDRMSFQILSSAGSRKVRLTNAIAKESLLSSSLQMARIISSIPRQRCMAGILVEEAENKCKS